MEPIVIPIITIFLVSIFLVYDIHTGNCSTGVPVNAEDFTVVTVMLNGVLENPGEAEAEYRQAWDDWLHY